MVVVTFLVGTALAVMLGTIAVGWTHGTLQETDQERIDREFERIVRRFGNPG